MSQLYQGVLFTGSLPRVTAAAIRRVERQFETIFPDDYRAFLKEVNGGSPTPQEFEMAEPGYPGGRICFDYFYGVGAACERFDLAYEQLELMERTEELPDGFVTIGHDPGAAPFFLGTEGEARGMVYFYDPSGVLDPGKSPRLYVAAHSFSDLLGRLAGGNGG